MEYIYETVFMLTVWIQGWSMAPADHGLILGESFQDYSWIQDFEADFP